MTTTPTFGVNRNGDGEIVGLWFTPDRVHHDGMDYLFLDRDEVFAVITELSEEIVSLVIELADDKELTSTEIIRGVTQLIAKG